MKPKRWIDILSSHSLNGVALLLILGSYIFLLPETPHMDGARWTRMLESYSLDFNPNYLLMEPIALGTFVIWTASGLPPNGQLCQQYLDVAFGMVALGILAICLGRVKLGGRWRILLILLAGFSYNFLFLSTSDHIKLITAPFLLLTLLFVIEFVQNGSPRRLILGGVCLGLAICTMINAIVWFILLMPVTYLISGGSRVHRLKSVLLFATTVAVTSGILFMMVYWFNAPPQSFLTWITSYGADHAAKDVGYNGLTIVTLGRAMFAVVKNFIYPGDAGSYIKELLIQRQSVAIPFTPVAILNVVALLSMVAIVPGAFYWVFRKRSVILAQDLRILLVAASAVLAFFLFGLLWNSSEEEFWFQITGPTILIMALYLKYEIHALRRLTFTVVAALIIANNIITFALPRHAYPYEANVRQLAEAVHDGDLVIHDGSAPMDALVYGALRRSPARFVSIPSALETHGYDLRSTLMFIQGEITGVKNGGGRLYVFGVLSSNTKTHPWTLFAERFGISPTPFVDLLTHMGTFEMTVLAGQQGWRLREWIEETQSGL